MKNMLTESITAKLLFIGFLVIILIIPSAWIREIITERQSRAEGVVQEISNKWSGSQTLSGPVLVIPYTKEETILKSPSDYETRQTTEQAFFLPETFSIDGTVTPEILNRGIFEAVVYHSNLSVAAKFAQPDFATLNIPAENVLWNQARIVMAVSHMTGITETPVAKIMNSAISCEASGNIGFAVKRYLKETQSGNEDDVKTAVALTEFAREGIVSNLKWNSAQDFQKDFSLTLALKGSQHLTFVPTGKSTTVNLTGPWSDPGFVGEIIPESRQVDDTSFSAIWKISNFNNLLPQQWIGEKEALTGSDFGIRFLVPVEQYQMSMRTAKYGHLIIILTFVALLLLEFTQNIRIHPLQYTLVGAALVIYYTLLLSFSEKVGYTNAYLIATVATIGLISAYSTSFLKHSRLVIILTLLMSIYYTFIFVIMVQQDYALLIGSIGLFVVVAALMYFSRNISLYKTTSTV